MANPSTKRYAFGILMVLIGTAILLKNLSLVPAEVPEYIFTWKVLLLIAGVYYLIFGRRWFAGLSLTGLGMYFLIPEVIGKPIADEVLLWPGLIILLGLYFLFTRPRKKNMKLNYFETKQENSDLMDITAIMGGLIVTSKKLSLIYQD